MITTDQLYQAMGCPMPRAQKWIKAINAAMDAYQIDTKLRIAHFLAQVGHESGRLYYVRELASGSAYEGRKDLGNTQKGDGVKYKGRGLIQLTGRYNYKLLTDEFKHDFINHPELLEEPQWAALSAGWYWDKRNLNILADADNILAITKKVNGGTNGLQDRSVLLTSAKQALYVS